MEIYLIRHTTPNIEKGICYGQTDLDVADTFEEEVVCVLTNLNDVNNATLYSSPLRRCKKLALKISSQVTEDDRLKEINFGDWELIKWDAINKTDLNIWMKDYVNKKIPNGESCIELYHRNIHFFKEITQKHKSKVIIVCHAGVIRSILSYVKAISIEESYNIPIKYGQVFKILKQNNNFIVK